TKPVEVGGRDRFLEPRHVPLERVPLGPAERVLRGESPVRVHVERDLVADRLARDVEPVRVPLRIAAELHLHPRNAAGRPARELLAEALVGVRAKPPAAVDGHVAVRGSEELDEREPVEPRAVRSQSAWSTADTAQNAIPGRPMFRTAAVIASHDARTSSETHSASVERTTPAAAASQYV